MKRLEKLLERRISLKKQHLEVIRGEIRDIRRELKKLRTEKGAGPNTKIPLGMRF